MHVSRILLAVLVAGVVACSVSAAADAVAGDNAPMLWPVPKSVAVSGPARSFATGFKIASTNKNANLVDAINRYNAIVQKEIAKATPLRLRHAASATSIVNVTVVVTGHDNSLGPNTDYSYLVEVAPTNSVVTIQAPSVFGAMYGMETFSQLIVNGMLNCSYAVINDAPQYRHRGLLVDSGRRFAPVPMLEGIMDAMAYSKMNVLHLHLSDWGGFRLEVSGLPQLTAGLNGQYYSQAQAAGLVDYATKRGIRIIAEVDVPSHSGCFAPLIPAGLKFCDSNNQLLASDNVTLDFVKKAMLGVMKAFPDFIFHQGGDETIPQGGCTWDDIHTFEKEIQNFVNANNRAPMAWNEVFSKPVAGTEPNAALPGTIIQNWEGSSASATASKGFASVTSEYKTLYLDQECCAAGAAAIRTGDKIRQCYYTDVAAGVAPAEKKLIYGGEAAMWTDVYCPNTHCPNEGQYSWMFPSSADAQFSESLTALIWPRTAGSAGAFWNYNPDMQLSASGHYNDVIEAHNSRLIARGVDSCPNGCTCDWGHKCGKPYGQVPPLPLKIQLTNKCDFQVKVREVTPCESGSGTTLAILQPGQQYVATQDFLVEGGKDPLKVGDPWAEWIGGGSWRDLASDIDILFNPSIPTYLVYNQTYPLPP